jgi:hypothetical protein
MTDRGLIEDMWVELLQRSEAQWGSLRSGSMAPTICAGERVLVRAGAPRPCPGDIVLFRKDGQLVVHRLIRRCRASESGVWIEKGDLNPLGGELAEQDILGTVTAVEKPGGVLRLDLGWRRLARPVFGLLARMVDGAARRAASKGSRVHESISERGLRTFAAAAKLFVRVAVIRDEPEGT